MKRRIFQASGAKSAANSFHSWNRETRESLWRLVVEEGDPGDSIPRFAEQNGVDLIMMPTHGHGTFRKFFLGSVTAKVLHDTSCPVWTAAHTGRPDLLGRFPSGNLLCAVDLAPGSVAIVRYAADLASGLSAKARIVYATGIDAARLPRIIDMGISHVLLQAGRVGLAELQKAAGTDCEGIVNMGDVPGVVASAATSLGALSSSQGAEGNSKLSAGSPAMPAQSSGTRLARC